MERLGIEIRTIWPLHGSECCVEFDTVEHVEILKWPKHLAFQHGPEIDLLLTSVSKAQCQRVGWRRFQSARRDGWRDSCRLLLSTQGLNLERRFAGLQERPVPQQFCMVDFGPRLDESLLRSRKAKEADADGGRFTIADFKKSSMA